MATNMKKKAQRAAENKEKRPFAVAKYVRVSPYKVRTVLALIRGKDYKEAKAILEHITNGSALAVKKVVGATSLKRMQPVSKGRGHAILKRTSHITVILDVKKLEGEL